LTSTQYATDFNETEASGSNLPNPDATGRRDTAWFWNANLISQLNRALEDFATQNSMDLLDTVRLLAMGTMVTTRRRHGVPRLQVHVPFLAPDHRDSQR
jgi:hypothetical protein